MIQHEEIKKIKNFAPPGMKLMGFKPRSYLKVWHNIKHSYFLFPDEKKTRGASQCTDALIKEMVRQDKIAIVKMAPRVNSQVRICALIAQEERVDPADGFQTPAGFQLIPLPYADDIRGNKEIFENAGFGAKDDNGEGIIQTLSKEEKQAAKQMVKNLKIDFDSRNFENPTIQRFFSSLQALALKEDEPEEIVDSLEPDYEGLKKLQPIIDKFKNTFFDGHDQDQEIGAKPKRGRQKVVKETFESGEASP